MYWHLSGCQEAVAVFSKLLHLRPSLGSADGLWQHPGREAEAEATVRGTWNRQLITARAAPPVWALGKPFSILPGPPEAFVFK